MDLWMLHWKVLQLSLGAFQEAMGRVGGNASVHVEAILLFPTFQTRNFHVLSYLYLWGGEAGLVHSKSCFLVHILVSSCKTMHQIKNYKHITWWVQTISNGLSSCSAASPSLIFYQMLLLLSLCSLSQSILNLSSTTIFIQCLAQELAEQCYRWTDQLTHSVFYS